MSTYQPDDPDNARRVNLYRNAHHHPNPDVGMLIKRVVAAWSQAANEAWTPDEAGRWYPVVRVAEALASAEIAQDRSNPHEMTQESREATFTGEAQPQPHAEVSLRDRVARAIIDPHSHLDDPGDDGTRVIEADAVMAVIRRELTALRAVADMWSSHADEIHNDLDEAQDRAERAEATLARVRDLHDGRTCTDRTGDSMTGHEPCPTRAATGDTGEGGHVDEFRREMGDQE